MFFKLLFLFGIMSVPMLLAMEQAVNADTETAYFAGGCFWCMEPPFENHEGVIEVTAGYIGGTRPAPSYEEVSTGRTGYLEAVKVVYDPSKVTYPELLDIFWRQIDPTDEGGQFADRGSQYHTAIFYATPEQKRQAEKSRDALDASGAFNRPIVTAIREAATFYPAERYHQDYYKTNPVHYQLYKSGSGRERFLDEMWHSAATNIPATATTGTGTPAANGPEAYAVPDDAELRQTLTPLQYEVTREAATEPPFDNEYWDNHREGIYVDVISGRPLFSSTDKYDSGSGWPSFTRPIDESLISEVEDRSLLSVRTEVRTKYGGAHLGHVFDDGPGPTGLRYCINSAALRFVPKEDMNAEGYGEYLRLFEK